MIADGLIVDSTVNTAPPDYTVNTAPVACKDLVLLWAEQASRAKAQGAHETNLGETKISRQVENSGKHLLSKSGFGSYEN